MRAWPLTLRLRPARMPLIICATMHCIVAFSFVAAAMPPGLTLAVLVLTGVSLTHALRTERGKRLRALVLHADGRLCVAEEGVAGDQSVRRLRSVDAGRVVWLSWQGSGWLRRDALMLVPDNLERPEDWRLLRVWLRLLAAPESGVKPEFSAPPDASRGV